MYRTPSPSPPASSIRDGEEADPLKEVSNVKNRYRIFLTDRPGHRSFSSYCNIPFGARDHRNNSRMDHPVERSFIPMTVLGEKTRPLLPSHDGAPFSRRLACGSPPMGRSFRFSEKELPRGRLQEVNTMENAKERQEKEQTKSPPVEKLSAGGVRLARWANKGPNGATYHTVTLERVYRRSDGEWGSTRTFRVQDIPRVILVLQRAYENVVLAGAVEEAAAGD